MALRRMRRAACGDSGSWSEVDVEELERVLFGGRLYTRVLSRRAWTEQLGGDDEVSAQDVIRSWRL